MAILFVTHDLRAASMADRILIMNDGQLVEAGTTEQIFNEPKEEYTKMCIRDSYMPLHRFVIIVPHFSILALMLYQIRMCSAFRYRTVFHHQYLICILDSRKPMCNHNNRFILYKSIKGLLDLMLILRCV